MGKNTAHQLAKASRAAQDNEEAPPGAEAGGARHRSTIVTFEDRIEIKFLRTIRYVPLSNVTWKRSRVNSASM
jgi:hypothetical protein